jgi:hypothetical protein
MKTLTKSILTVLCVTLLSSIQLFGQEWSEEQKEVWAGVENWWQAWADGDINKINSCIAEGFRGWREDFYAPSTILPLFSCHIKKFGNIKMDQKRNTEVNGLRFTEK